MTEVTIVIPAYNEEGAIAEVLAHLVQVMDASGLVHELKNPLGAISLTVEMLLQQCQQGHLDPDRTRCGG